MRGRLRSVPAMPRTYVAEARKRVGPKKQRIVPIIERLARRAPGRDDRASLPQRARAARVGDALRADDRRECQPRHGAICSRSTAGPRTTLPCRSRSSSATSTRRASSARRRRRSGGRCRRCSRSSTASSRGRSTSSCACRAWRARRRTSSRPSSATRRDRRRHARRRLSQRLGLTKQEDPVKIERDLVRLVPREYWGVFPHLLIWHGRRVCIARRPLCEQCALTDLCPSSRASVPATARRAARRRRRARGRGPPAQASGFRSASSNRPAGRSA